MANVKVQVRRAYEDQAQGDGTRVLAGRTWPRGLTKAMPDFGGFTFACRQADPDFRNPRRRVPWSIGRKSVASGLW